MNRFFHKLKNLKPPQKVFRIFGFGEFLFFIFWLAFGVWNSISPMHEYKGATVTPVLGKLAGILVIISCLYWTWQNYKTYKKELTRPSSQRAARVG
jgi:hypothetical protein